METVVTCNRTSTPMNDPIDEKRGLVPDRGHRLCGIAAIAAVALMLAACSTAAAGDFNVDRRRNATGRGSASGRRRAPRLVRGAWRLLHRRPRHSRPDGRGCRVRAVKQQLPLPGGAEPEAGTDRHELQQRHHRRPVGRAAHRRRNQPGAAKRPVVGDRACHPRHWRQRRRLGLHRYPMRGTGPDSRPDPGRKHVGSHAVRGLLLPRRHGPDPAADPDGFRAAGRQLSARSRRVPGAPASTLSATQTCCPPRAAGARTRWASQLATSSSSTTRNCGSMASCGRVAQAAGDGYVDTYGPSEGHDACSAPAEPLDRTADPGRGGRPAAPECGRRAGHGGRDRHCGQG